MADITKEAILSCFDKMTPTFSLSEIRRMFNEKDYSSTLNAVVSYRHVSTLRQHEVRDLLVSMLKQVVEEPSILEPVYEVLSDEDVEKLLAGASSEKLDDSDESNADNDTIVFLESVVNAPFTETVVTDPIISIENAETVVTDPIITEEITATIENVEIVAPKKRVAVKKSTN